MTWWCFVRVSGVYLGVFCLALRTLGWPAVQVSRPSPVGWATHDLTSWETSCPICHGCCVDTELKAMISSGSGSYPLRMSWLTPQEKKNTYKGFSNPSSWKLLVVQPGPVIMFPVEHTPAWETVKGTRDESTGLSITTYLRPLLKLWAVKHKEGKLYRCLFTSSWKLSTIIISVSTQFEQQIEISGLSILPSSSSTYE